MLAEGGYLVDREKLDQQPAIWKRKVPRCYPDHRREIADAQASWGSTPEVRLWGDRAGNRSIAGDRLHGRGEPAADTKGAAPRPLL